MSQISQSDHGETSFRSRQQNRQLSEMPRISFRESEHDEQLPRFSRVRREVSAPIGIQQTRIRRRLTLVRKTLYDDAGVAIQREQRLKVTTSENPSKHPSKTLSEPKRTTGQQSINQSIIKNSSTMSDTTESASTMPFTPLAPVVYHFRMPRPGEAGALFFDKMNVSEFLKRWEEECEEVGYTDAQKCVKLPAYCAEDTRIAIRNLRGYEAKNWVMMCGEMKDLFQAHDRPLYTKEYLNELVGKGQGSDLKLFIATFQAVSNDLVKREVISKRQQVLEFVAGLGSHLRRKAFDFAAQNDWKLTEDDIGSKEPSYQELQDHILDKAKSDQKNAVFDRHFSSIPATPDVPPVDSARSPPEKDGKMDKLIEAMASLSLVVETVQKQLAETAGSRSSASPGITVPRSISCHWCKSVDHVRSKCPLFDEVLQSGKIQWNDSHHIVFAATGEEIPLNWRGGGQKEIFDSEMAKVSKATASSAKASTNVIVAEPAYGSLGEDRSVIYATLYDDGTIREEVVDVEVEEKRKRDDVEQSGRRTRPRQDRQEEGTFSPGARSGPSNPNPADPEDPSTSVPHSVEKPGEPKAKYQLLSKLSETLSVEDIGAKILDTPVALPLSELLSVSGDLSTFIHEQTRKRRVPVEQFRSQTVATVTTAPGIIRASINSISGEASFYACPSGRVKATIDDTIKIEALLDSGSEVNIMPKRTFDRLDFPIDKNIEWHINGFGDDERVGSSCLGVCHDVPVDIGGVTVKTHVFVVKHAAQNLLLGRPWEREARAIFTNADNGDYLCTIRSQDGRRVVDFCAARSQHPRNRQHARGLDDGYPARHLNEEELTH